MTFGELPFGIRNCKILSAKASSTVKVVPRIRTVEVNVTRDSTDLEAQDVKFATHTFSKSLSGTIEAGGINLAVLVVLEGGVITSAGMTPNRTAQYDVLGDQTEYYFALEGQMYADDGGDSHIIAYKLKASNGPNYSFAQGAFALTHCDLTGVYDDSVDPSQLYSLTQNETITAIALA